MIVRISDLRLREVVNTCDGRRMGFITDLDLDLDTGKVKAFVIPGAKRILPIFGKTEDIVIPWNKVKKIGIDFILVELENLVEGVISE